MHNLDVLVSPRQRPQLTECRGESLWLVIVDDGDAHGVQGHHTQDHPVEALSFHHAPDEETEHFLLPAEVRGALVLAALQAGPGKGRTCGHQRSRKGFHSRGTLRSSRRGHPNVHPQHGASATSVHTGEVRLHLWVTENAYTDCASLISVVFRPDFLSVDAQGFTSVSQSGLSSIHGAQGRSSKRME